jgi:transglutaminase-like putative cysteine protease
MKYIITHKTSYKYSAPASLSQNELCLFPRSTASQDVLDSRLVITPKAQYLSDRRDYFGNKVHVFMVQHTHQELSVVMTSLVVTRKPALPQLDLTINWEEAVRLIREYANPEELDARQYTFPSPLVPIIADAYAYGKVSFPEGRPILAGACDLVKRIFTDFTYDKTASSVDTPMAQVLANRRGVCQDFAHVAISCLRSLGLATRYVSGYLETIPPAGKPRLVGADASHAWISVFVPGFGWVGLDPTNNLTANETYITVAWGRDYGDVVPDKGVVMGGGLHELSVMVDVAAQAPE